MSKYIFYGQINYFDWAILNSYVKLPEATVHKILTYR